MKTTKKVVSIILVLTLALGAFAFSSNAASVKSTVTYGVLSQISTSKQLHIKGTLNDFSLGSKTFDIPFTIDASGNTVSIEAKLSFLNVRALYINNKIYVMVPFFGFNLGAGNMLGAYGETVANLLSRIWNEMQFFEQDFVLGETSAAADFHGTSYGMETIIENTKTPSFNAKIYYNADKQIKGVVASSTTLDKTFDITIDEISATADSSKTVFPLLYIDLSFIIAALIGSLAGGVI